MARKKVGPPKHAMLTRAKARALEAQQAAARQQAVPPQQAAAPQPAAISQQATAPQRVAATQQAAATGPPSVIAAPTPAQREQRRRGQTQPPESRSGSRPVGPTTPSRVTERSPRGEAQDNGRTSAQQASRSRDNVPETPLQQSPRHPSQQTVQNPPPQTPQQPLPQPPEQLPRQPPAQTIISLPPVATAATNAPANANPTARTPIDVENLQSLTDRLEGYRDGVDDGSILPGRNASSVLVDASQMPFDDHPGIHEVPCDRVYGAEDYLTYQDMILFSPVKPQEDPHRIFRKRKNSENHDQFLKRRCRMEDADEVLRLNRRAEAKFLEELVYTTPRERDRKHGEWLKAAFETREKNWARIHRWRKDRQARRRKLLQQLNLRDHEDFTDRNGAKIGEGAHARVYLKIVGRENSQDTATSQAPRLVAVKVGYSYRIQPERQWLKRLGKYKPWNIVKILDEYNVGDCIWSIIAMDHANCGDLHEFLFNHHRREPGLTDDGREITKLGWKEGDPARMLPEEILWAILLQTLKGVNFLHNGINPTGERVEKKWTPIFHMDIKPENILVYWRPERKDDMLFLQYDFVMSDFGLAQFDEKMKIFNHHGTTDYDSPESGSPCESWTSKEGPGPDSMQDIWSIGAMLHFATTWQLPWYLINDKHSDNAHGKVDPKEQPLHIIPIHIPPGQKLRFDNEGLTPNIVMRAQRHYSTGLSYQLHRLLGPVERLDPQVRRFTAAEAVKSVTQAIEQIEAVESAEHDEASAGMSRFEWQTQKCRKSDTILESLLADQKVQVRDRFRKALEITGQCDMQKAQDSCKWILEKHFDDPVQGHPAHSM